MPRTIYTRTTWGSDLSDLWDFAHSMRGQCWWKGGPENELAFSMGAVKLGPFKLGKDKNEVKTYKFFVHDGKVGGWVDWWASG